MKRYQRDYTAYTLLWQRRRPDEPPLSCRTYAQLRAELDPTQLRAHEE